MSEEKQEKKQEQKPDKKAAAKAASKEIEALKSENEGLKAKVEAKDLDYKKLYAEFDTFRRRTIEESKSLRDQAAADVIKGMLGVLDQCEIALQTLEASSDEAAKQGTKLIYENLLTYLKSKGLEPMKALGEKFDVDFHEAIMMQPGDESQKGKVILVARAGYLFCGKVIRHAQVIVGA